MRILLIGLFLFTALGMASGDLNFPPVDSRLFPYLALEKDDFYSDNSAQDIYNGLQKRFENDDFTELLFVGDPSESSRFSLAGSKRVLKNISRLFKHDEALISYLKIKPKFEAFYVDTQRRQPVPLNLNVDSWRDGLLDTLSDFIDQYHHRETSEELLQHILQSKLDFIKTKNLDHLNKISKLLGGYYLYKLFRENLDTLRTLPDELLFFLVESYRAATIQKIRELKLPGKLENDWSHFFKIKQQKNPFKSKIVVMPMSKWDALYKGIGPGECIRESANRYFDAFYPFSRHFAIFRDGKEIGYIGIYNVEQKGSSQKIWYIDAIQSPGLVENSGIPRVLDVIKLQLQKWALSQNALLATASRDWNAMNFKDVTNYLEGRGKMQEVEVDFPVGDTYKSILHLVSTPELEADQLIMSKSGYKKNNKMMYDSIKRNSHKVNVLPPHPDLSISEMKAGLTMLGIPVRDELFVGRQLSEEIQKLILMSQYPTNSETLEYVYVKMETLRRRLLDVGILSELSKNMFSDLLHFMEVENIDQINIQEVFLRLGKSNTPNRNQILLQTLYLTSDLVAAFNVINTFSLKTTYEMNFFTTSGIPHLHRLGYEDWLNLFKAALSKSPTNQTDMNLGIAILGKLSAFEEFFEFAMISLGKRGSMHMSNQKEANALLAGSISKFVENRSLNSVIEIGEQLLNLSNSTFDIRIRDMLLSKAETLEDVLRILQLSNPPEQKYFPDYVQKISPHLKRIMEKSPVDLEKINKILVLLQHQSESYLDLALNTAYPKLIQSGVFSPLDFYKQQLAFASNAEEDLRVYKTVEPYIKDSESLVRFMSISCGLEGKIFLDISLREDLLSQTLLKLSQNEMNLDAHNNLLAMLQRLGLKKTVFKVFAIRTAPNFSQLWRSVDILSQEYSSSVIRIISLEFTNKLKTLLNRENIQLNEIHFSKIAIDWDIVLESLTIDEINSLKVSNEILLSFFKNKHTPSALLSKLKTILYLRGVEQLPTIAKWYAKVIKGLMFPEPKAFRDSDRNERYNSTQSIPVCRSYFQGL